MWTSPSPRGSHSRRHRQGAADTSTDNLLEFNGLCESGVWVFGETHSSACSRTSSCLPVTPSRFLLTFKGLAISSCAPLIHLFPVQAYREQSGSSVSSPWRVLRGCDDGQRLSAEWGRGWQGVCQSDWAMCVCTSFLGEAVEGACPAHCDLE